MALARVEGLRVLRHPLWWLGVLASAGLAALDMSWQVAEYLTPTDWYVARLAEFATPIAMMTLVIAHLAAGRLERDDMVDVAISVSASAVTRRLGLVAAQAVPASGALVIAGGVSTWLSLQTAGDVGMADLLHVPAWVLLGGVLGVAVARLSTAIVVGPLAVVVVTVPTYVLLNDPSILQRLTPVHDWIPDAAWPGMLPRAEWIHLALLLGLVCLAMVVAVVGRRSRPRATTTVAAMTVALVAIGLSAFTLVSPVDPAAVTRTRSIVADPVANSTCMPLVGEVTWCSPVDIGETRRLIGRQVATAEDLLGPNTLATPVTLQAVGTLGSLQVEIGFDLGVLGEGDTSDFGRTGMMAGQDGTVMVRSRDGRLDVVRDVLAVAWLELDTPDPEVSEVTGIDEPGDSRTSLETGSNPGMCTLAGQARGALLLAVADLAVFDTPRPLPTVEKGDSLANSVSAVSVRTSGDMHVGVDVGPGSARFTWEQVQVAHHLAAAGPGAIEALDDWQHWSDPSTTLDELVAATGVPAPTTVHATIRAAYARADARPPTEQQVEDAFVASNGPACQ